MRLSFDTIDEVKDFVKQLKGTRGGKAGEADEGQPATGNAPAPLAPPQGAIGGFPGTAGFAPPMPGAAPGGGFPAAVAPEVQALVARITTRLDQAIGMGQSDDALKFFRTQCGPEAANATMDQIKGVFLPKASVPTLEQIAKLMAA